MVIDLDTNTKSVKRVTSKKTRLFFLVYCVFGLSVAMMF